MRYVLPLAKIVAGLAVLVVVVLVGYIVADMFKSSDTSASSPEELITSSDVETKDEEPVVEASPIKLFIVEGKSIEALAEKLRKAAARSEYEPGEKAFAKASEMLASGFFFEAEDKLKELIETYPYAPSVHEARRIVGAVNMDRVFSDSSAVGQEFYKVKSGDSYFKIAKNYETSLINLMVINDLFSLDKLRRDTELLVMPLHFNLVIDIPNTRLILEFGKKFIKDYPFKKLIFTKKSGREKTLISEVHALTKKGAIVNPTKSSYVDANKVIQIDNPQIEIVGDDYEVDDTFRGIILERDQIEELSILLREGNLVEINY